MFLKPPPARGSTEVALLGASSGSGDFMAGGEQLAAKSAQQRTEIFCMTHDSLQNGVPPLAQFGPHETARLRLRRYVEDDAELVHGMMSDATVMRYYPSLYDAERSRALIDYVLNSYARYGYSFLVVERKPDLAYAGHVGLLHWDDVDGREDVEVAYMLRREHWGNGYATEAARISRDWAFAHTATDRVVSFIDVNNEASISVARRNGMRLLHRLEQNRFGRPIYVYGLSRDEWPAAVGQETKTG
jgi:RimJ/RimL family protein N-acetyltransferase